MDKVKSENIPQYGESDDIIYRALVVLENRLRKPGEAMNSPATVKNYLTLKLATEEREIFSVLFLNSQHRVLEYCPMFMGTLNQTAVYPREIVKKALAVNAAAVIVAHNHPSGNPSPSDADRKLTEELKKALALVEVRLLDHVIVGGIESKSFIEMGIL